MKVYGLDSKQVKSILKGVDPALVFSVQSERTGFVQGILYYPLKAKSPYALIVDGKLTKGVCGHTLVEAVKALFIEGTKVSPKKPSNVVAGKLVFKYGDFGNMPKYKQLVKKQKGVCSHSISLAGKTKFDGKKWTPALIGKPHLQPICNKCGDVMGNHYPEGDNVDSPNSNPDKWLCHLEKYPYSHTAKKAEPIISPALTGEKGWSKTFRPLGASVANLYILQDLGWRLNAWLIKSQVKRYHSNGNGTVKLQWENDAPSRLPMGYLRLRQLVDEFDSYKLAYEHDLARNFFDYLALACAGEARHGKGLTIDGNHYQNTPRDSLFKLIADYDPKRFLPQFETLFSEDIWNGGYGGPSWAKIAKAAMLYFTAKEYPVVMADHVVDLTHNGGLAFNKHIIFERDLSDSTYLRMLDLKKNGSLLYQNDMPIPISYEIRRYINRFVEWHILDVPTADLVVSQERITRVPFVPWGDKPLTLALTEVEHEQEEEKESQDRERYPVSRRAS